MHRALALVATLLLLLTASFQSATARQATPAAGTTGPTVGTPVTVLGTEGTEVATATVTELIDPFDGYDPNSPPDRGFHFVFVAVTISNSGTRPYEANPNDIALVDSDGFLYSQGGLYRGSDPTPPDFEYQGELAPGAEASGALGFQVLNGVQIAQVVYTPDSDRLITLVDRRTDLPALGTAVSFLGTEGTEAGQITVAGVADPFADYDPSSPPQRGSHFVLVTAMIANTGTRPLEADPGDLYLLDADGFLSRSTSVRRADNATPPDFEYQRELAPSAEATGVVAYEVLNGTTPIAVVYLPASDRLITAAALGDTAEPRPTPRPGAATVTPPAGATASAATTTGGTVDCAPIATWLDLTNARFTTFVGLLNELSTMETPTPADLPRLRQAAADAETAAEKQRNSQPPAEAEALNDVLVNYYTDVSKALAFLADGVEADDPAQQLVAVANMGEIGQKFQTDVAPLYNELVAICPP
ncbi:MAG: hypothetical protein QOJ59_1146 [Thermomicrobiales bacterium]|jgi:hypothetical protein|nr:hypothetical protein [Thermomicrobiales bacterium]